MRHETIYMTAEQLGITEREREGLIVLRADLAEGRIAPERFDMRSFCGTACCIGGHLMAQGYIEDPRIDVGPLLVLFYPVLEKKWRDITPAQAARAIGNFLSSGRPRWDEAVKEH